MRKKHLSLVAALLTSILWWGCTPHDNVKVIFPQYFVEELSVWNLKIEDGMAALLKELDLDRTDPALSQIMGMLQGYLKKEIRAVAISYRTMDPCGDPVLGTGAFFYPPDLKHKGVVEIPPIAYLERRECAALYVERKKFYREAFPCMLNYITINPDLLGVLYTQDMPRPFLQDANTGIVAFHMRKAVEEYLLVTENYRLEKHSSIGGYSLGGAAALSMAKYYSTNPTGIKVDQVLTGGGIYDGLEAFRAYSLSEQCDYPAIPPVIIAMDTFYNLGLDYSKIFANGMENPVNSPDPAAGGDGYAYWFDGTHMSKTIHQRWGSDLHNYMHEDFFHREPVGEFLKLQDCMKENSLVYNWTPDPLLKIRLIHSDEDNMVPVECADLLYHEYKKKDCAITYNRTTGDHYQAGSEFVLTAMLYLLLK